MRKTLSVTDPNEDLEQGWSIFTMKFTDVFDFSAIAARHETFSRLEQVDWLGTT